MSNVFQLYCKTCEENGPKIRRGGSVSLLTYYPTGPFDDQYKEAANQVWHEFLSEHAFHDLRLETGP